MHKSLDIVMPVAEPAEVALDAVPPCGTPPSADGLRAALWSGSGHATLNCFHATAGDARAMPTAPYWATWDGLVCCPHWG